MQAIIVLTGKTHLAFKVLSWMALVGAQLIFKMKLRNIKLTIIVVYEYFISLCCVYTSKNMFDF